MRLQCDALLALERGSRLDLHAGGAADAAKGHTSVERNQRLHQRNGEAFRRHRARAVGLDQQFLAGMQVRAVKHLNLGVGMTDRHRQEGNQRRQLTQVGGVCTQRLELVGIAQRTNPGDRPYDVADDLFPGFFIAPAVFILHLQNVGFDRGTVEQRAQQAWVNNRHGIAVQGDIAALERTSDLDAGIGCRIAAQLLADGGGADLDVTLAEVIGVAGIQYGIFLDVDAGNAAVRCQQRVRLGF